MALALPLLPWLAMLSSEAAAAAGATSAEQEQKLQTLVDQLPPSPPSQPAASAPPPEATQPAILTEDGALNADDVLIDGRRRPGHQKGLPERVTQDNPGAVRAPPPEAFPPDSYDMGIPDRWRLVSTLCPTATGIFGAINNVCHSVRDPYHQNVLKGDRPLCLPTEEEQRRREEAHIPRCATPRFLGLDHDDWFFNLNLISDSIVEPRSFPTPVGVQTTERPGSLDVFGRAQSLVLAQTFIAGFTLYKGSTTFKPPEMEYTVALAYNVSYVDVSERRILNVRPSVHSHRVDHFLGVQEFFIDRHIRNTSDRYDFDSVRVGIQPFQADFRGFLFQDSQLGVRLFGNRDNNRWQYNIAAFWRLEKDTNSGLNSVIDRPRDDWVFLANLYRQDFPAVGMVSQVSVAYNMNREAHRIQIDDNGFPARPALLGDLRGREYDVVYPGYSMDGHFGRVNLTASVYGAFGEDRNSFFTSKPAKIRAFFAAAEPSIDIDWARFRVSALYASGDKRPYDNKETGFDAIFENPIFAGADTSYWIRQVIPFAGGGRAVGINTRNGVLNNLRTSKEQGQSNFNNPGTILLGTGVDADITPKLRVSANFNHLWFANTATLQALRVEGSIPRSIGNDVSVAAIYRPKAIQNVVFRLSGALFDPSKGFRDLFTTSRRDDRYYSVLFDVVTAF